MYELAGTTVRPNRGKALVAAGALLSAVALAGCSSQGETPWNPDFSVGLPRCYDEPLEPRYEQNGKKLDDTPPVSPQVTIRQDRQGVIAGYPGGMPNKIRQAIDPATVIIYNAEKETTSSGFVTTASNGEKVIGATAHGVDAANVGNLIVIDRNYQKTRVLGGCFMRENHRKKHAAGDQNVSSTDIAVLKVATSFTQNKPALKTSNISVARGKWGSAIATRNFNTNGFVSSGVMSLGQLANYQTVYLSGVQSGKRCRDGTFEQPPLCAGQPGNSGTPIVDRATGKVAGILTGGRIIDYPGYLSNRLLQKEHGVRANFTVGPESGTWPVVIFATDASVLNTALKSPRATQLAR